MQSMQISATRSVPASAARCAGRAQTAGRPAGRPLVAPHAPSSLPARSAPAPLRSADTSDAVTERRIRESQRVEERTTFVNNAQELDAFLTDAGDKLVFLNIESPDECDLSDFPDPKDIQRTVSDNPMAPCARVKQTLARVARECDDAIFLTLEVEDENSEQAKLARELGVSRYPTFQYYKNSELMWEHTGAGMYTNHSIGEGMLYYAGQAAGGEHSEDYITEIKSMSELEDFKQLCAAPQTTALGVDLDVPCELQLAVVDVSQQKNCAASVHIFPAVLALAKNTAGACRWARCLIDTSPQAAALAESLNVSQVPAFIIFNGDKEVGRYVGSDRLALMNTVIQIQKDEGIRMPDRKARKRIPTSEAKRIAREARAKQKSDQWTM